MNQDCAARRASPLPPDERRAAILAATVPLLRERGAAVSTRELAEAAGVAEGTIFRVFPDKRALLRAALAEAMEPSPLLDELARVERSAPLEERIRRVLCLVTERTDGIVQLMTALHGLARDEAAEPQPPHRGPVERTHETYDVLVLAAIAAVLEPDSARLRVTPLQVAGLLRAVVLGERMPGLPDGARLAPDAVAACLVRGLVADQRQADRRDAVQPPAVRRDAVQSLAGQPVAAES